MTGSSFGRGTGGWTGSTGVGSRVVTVVGLLLFTLFWCGITGVFVGFLGRTAYQIVDARRRFVPVEATVTASRVVTSRGSKGGTNYRPVVEYTYTVAGREYHSDRYQFMPFNSASGAGPGQSAAAAVVGRCPPGAKLTVYYDPAQPESVAVSRELPDILVFMALFLQPFLLIGIGMMIAVVLAVRDVFRAHGFRNGSARRPPWPIPEWGVLQREPGGASVLRGGGRAVAAAMTFAFGYGLTCFISIFVLMFGFMLLLEGKYGMVTPALVAFALAPVVGAIAALWTWSKGDPKVTFRLDPMRGTLMLFGGPLQPPITLRLSEIAGLLVRTVVNEAKFKQKNAPRQLERAVLVTTDGAELKLHDFQVRADADRVAAEFAALLGVPVQKVPETAGNAGPRTLLLKTLGDVFSLIRDEWRKNRTQRKGPGIR